MRPALKLPPTYGVVDETHDAYVPGLKLRQLAKQHGRYWLFHSSPTTVALPNNRFAKNVDNFAEHTTEEQFRELLAEYAEHNCPRPGSYADVFHELYKSPRVAWSVNAQLAPCMAGGWQEAKRIGVHHGRFYKYDMCSAYLWAATLGLPDVRTYTRSLHPATERHPGVYRVKLVRTNPIAPFPFNQGMECIATAEEIETYNLEIASVVDGVIWKRTIDTAPIIDTIKQTSTWKLAARAYWGRWAQIQQIECVSKTNRWVLPNITLNIPWAHMIVSRVKMRLWRSAGQAVHVFVDSIITPERLSTGPELGDWRLERTYLTGVRIRGPGQYGSLEDMQLERMAGVAKDSLRRNTSVAAA